MQEEFLIRRMKTSDIPQIIKIGLRVREFVVDPKSKIRFWSQKQLKNWVNSKKDALIVAENGKKVIGFVFFAHHVPTGKVTFENAWVSKEFRGRKVGEALINEGMKILKKEGAVYFCALARTNNNSSISFLRKNKFNKGLAFSWLDRTW